MLKFNKFFNIFFEKELKMQNVRYFDFKSLNGFINKQFLIKKKKKIKRFQRKKELFKYFFLKLLISLKKKNLTSNLFIFFLSMFLILN